MTDRAELGVELQRLLGGLGLDPKQFRFFGIDGQGHIHVVGNLPWSEARQPLRAWLRDWASGLDPLPIEAEAALREHWQGPGQGSGLGRLRDQLRERLVAECGKREGFFGFHVLWEMMGALVRRLKREGMAGKPLTAWEFRPSTNGETQRQRIQGWLFGRR